MSKRLFILAALVLCVSLSAGDIKDTWFDTLYSGILQNLPDGCQLRKDAARRIIFLDMPLPSKSSISFDISAAKSAIVKALKETPDADFIRKAGIIVIYNYVTTDQKIHSVVITKEDL